MSAPTVGNTEDFGKPIFDSVSNYPIYGGSPSSGVYVDETWVEAVLDSTNMVYLYYNKAGAFLGNAFSTALDKINSTSNSLPSGARVYWNAAPYPFADPYKWYRFFETVDNSTGTTFDFWRVMTNQQVFVYKLPTGVSATAIYGVYVEYASSTDAVSAFISDDSNIATKILNLPLSGSADFSSCNINTEGGGDLSGANKVVVVPFIPDDALTSSDYTLVESGDSSHFPHKVNWTTAFIDLVPTKVYLKIKV